MADGSVNIDTRLETGNIRRDVQQVNDELNRIGSDLPDRTRVITDDMGNRYDSLGRRIRYAYRGTSEEARRMYSEMRSAHYQQAIAMRGMKDQMIGVQYQYFKLAQSSQTYTGTTAQFMSQVRQLGSEQKRVTDAMINANRLQMISMLQTAGVMMNMTTQAQRISQNYDRMANPLYRVNNAGLSVANSLNQMANRGNAAVLALNMLGPTASMKSLLDMQRMITQGLMRFQMVALMAAASSALLYGSLHKANMEMNPKYAEAYNNMMENLTKALQPMRDAFVAITIPIYNFVSAIAELIIKFNEAHPTLAKFIQGTIMLIPLLTLILSPLAIGIGLWNGMLAAWNSIWMLISPLVTGLAAMSATVWIVAAAVVGLTMGITHLWKTNEKFRESIKGAVGAVKEFGNAIVSMGKFLLSAAIDGDKINDWITHLPDSWQPAAEKMGAAVVKIRGHVIEAGKAAKQFGQHMIDMSKYMFYAALDGDSANDWITHLPDKYRGAAEGVGNAIVSMREYMLQGANQAKKFGTDMFNLSSYLVEVGKTSDLANKEIMKLPAGMQGTATIMGSFVNNIVSKFTEAAKSVSWFTNTLVNMGKYLFWVAASGDTMNDWITHLPAGMVGAAQLIAQSINKIRDTILQLFEAIKLAFNGDFSGLAQVFSQIGPMIVGFLLGGIPAIILTAARFLPAITQGITSGLPILVDTITTIINNFVTVFTTYLPMLVQVGIEILTTLISGLIQALPLIVQSLVTIMTSLVTLISQTLTTLLPLLLNAGIQILMAIINGIVQNLPLIINAMIQMVNQLANAIVVNLPLILNAGIQILMALLNGIVQMLPLLIQTAVDLLTQISNMIIQNLPLIIDAGIQILISLINGIIQVLPQLIDAAVNLILQIANALIQNLPKIIDAGIKILNALIKGIVQILPQLIETGIKLIIEIAKAIIDHLPEILDAGVKIIKALIDGILQMAGELGSAMLNHIGKTITNTIKDINLFDIGKNIIDGLVNGLKSMAGSVKSVVGGIAGDIKDKITSALNIHSPSRWMRDMIGKNMMLGWQIGIDREKSPTLKKAEEMASWFKPSMPDLTPSYAGYGSYGNSSSSSVTNNTPISITLNYSGDASRNDVLSMVDAIEKELSSRLGISSFMMGVKS